MHCSRRQRPIIADFRSNRDSRTKDDMYCFETHVQLCNAQNKTDESKFCLCTELRLVC
jgi:hypothetical protein